MVQRCQTTSKRIWLASRRLPGQDPH